MRLLIVGAGVIGLFTAMAAVRAGHQVVVCEQGPVPNPAGTSYDHSRVLRALHPGDPAATAAATRAHAAWRRLDHDLGGGLYHLTGSLTAFADDADLAAARAVLPSVRSVPAGEYPMLGADRMLFEPDAGVLLASRILAAVTARLRGTPGVSLREHQRVTTVTGTAVRLADGSALDADAVLVAAGPWATDLLPRRDLVLYRQTQAYAQPGDFAAVPPAKGLPGGGWLVPPVAGTPLKVSASTACRAVEALTDHTAPRRWREHLRDLFPTMTLTSARDSYYLADASTDGAAVACLGPHTVAFAACGGGAFKFAPLIATALLDRLAGGRPIDRAAFPHSVLREV